MFWGFSKSIGGGFRVGVGGRLSGGGRSRSGPTQAELRQQAKEDFIRDTKSRFEELVASYFFSQGYVLLAKDVLETNIKIAEPLKPMIHEFTRTQKLLEDGGNLTEKRKEQMLVHIYNLEDTVSKLETEHPILALYNKYTSKAGWGYLLIGISILVVLIGLFWNPMLFSLLVTGGLAFYLLRGAKALKGEIKQKAVQVISEI